MYEPGLVIRDATEEYLGQLTRMTIKFYRFNEEFDPAYSIKDNIEEIAEEYIKESIQRDDVILLIALWNEEPVGFARVEIRRHRLLKNGEYGALVELYVNPRFRRQGIASKLIDEARKELSKRNIFHLAAQFPAMNMIAEKFYTKHGFRPWTYVFIHEV